jgi:hypothetical protein
MRFAVALTIFNASAVTILKEGVALKVPVRGFTAEASLGMKWHQNRAFKLNPG